MHVLYLAWIRPPHHRSFLRFAFDGVTSKLSFLSDCLWQRVHILHYLDDWLVFAQSKHELCVHRYLCPLEFLRFRINLTNSSLPPSQQISFVGAVFDSAQMRAWLFARMLTENLVAHGIIQGWGLTSPQNILKAAGPYGSSLLCSASRPTTYALLSVLTEGVSSAPEWAPVWDASTSG